MSPPLPVSPWAPCSPYSRSARAQVGLTRGRARPPCAESCAAALWQRALLGLGVMALGEGDAPGHHSLLWLSPGDPQRPRPGGCGVGCGQKAQACPPSLGPAGHRTPPRGSVPSHTKNPGQRGTATPDLPPPLQEKATLNNTSYQRSGRYSVWLVAAQLYHNCILASIRQWGKKKFG